MIRVAVRTLTLNVFRVDCPRVKNFILDRSALPYFANLVWFIGDQSLTLDEFVVSSKGFELAGKLNDQVAEHVDHFYYLNDILTTGAPEIGEILCRQLIRKLVIPLYLMSLLDPTASFLQLAGSSADLSPTAGAGTGAAPVPTRVSVRTALTLLAQMMHIFSHSKLVSLMAVLLLAPTRAAYLEYLRQLSSNQSKGPSSLLVSPQIPSSTACLGDSSLDIDRSSALDIDAIICAAFRSANGSMGMGAAAAGADSTTGSTLLAANPPANPRDPVDLSGDPRADGQAAGASLDNPEGHSSSTSAGGHSALASSCGISESSSSAASHSPTTSLSALPSSLYFVSRRDRASEHRLVIPSRKGLGPRRQAASPLPDLKIPSAFTGGNGTNAGSPTGQASKGRAAAAAAPAVAAASAIAAAGAGAGATAPVGGPASTTAAAAAAAATPLADERPIGFNLGKSSDPNPFREAILHFLNCSESDQEALPVLSLLHLTSKNKNISPAILDLVGLLPRSYTASPPAAADPPPAQDPLPAKYDGELVSALLNNVMEHSHRCRPVTLALATSLLGEITWRPTVPSAPHEASLNPRHLHTLRSIELSTRSKLFDSMLGFYLRPDVSRSLPLTEERGPEAGHPGTGQQSPSFPGTPHGTGPMDASRASADRSSTASSRSSMASTSSAVSAPPASIYRPGPARPDAMAAGAEFGRTDPDALPDHLDVFEEEFVRFTRACPELADVWWSGPGAFARALSSPASTSAIPGPSAGAPAGGPPAAAPSISVQDAGLLSPRRRLPFAGFPAQLHGQADGGRSSISSVAYLPPNPITMESRPVAVIREIANGFCPVDVIGRLVTGSPVLLVPVVTEPGSVFLRRLPFDQRPALNLYEDLVGLIRRFLVIRALRQRLAASHSSCEPERELPPPPFVRPAGAFASDLVDLSQFTLSEMGEKAKASQSASQHVQLADLHLAAPAASGACFNILPLDFGTHRALGESLELTALQQDARLSGQPYVHNTIDVEFSVSQVAAGGMSHPRRLVLTGERLLLLDCPTHRGADASEGSATDDDHDAAVAGAATTGGDPHGGAPAATVLFGVTYSRVASAAILPDTDDGLATSCRLMLELLVDPAWVDTALGHVSPAERAAAIGEAVATARRRTSSAGEKHIDEPAAAPAPAPAPVPVPAALTPPPVPRLAARAGLFALPSVQDPRVGGGPLPPGAGGALAPGEVPPTSVLAAALSGHFLFSTGGPGGLADAAAVAAADASLLGSVRRFSAEFGRASAVGARPGPLALPAAAGGAGARMPAPASQVVFRTALSTPPSGQLHASLPGVLPVAPPPASMLGATLRQHYRSAFIFVDFASASDALLAFAELARYRAHGQATRTRALLGVLASTHFLQVDRATGAVAARPAHLHAGGGADLPEALAAVSLSDAVASGGGPPVPGPPLPPSHQQQQQQQQQQQHLSRHLSRVPSLSSCPLSLYYGDSFVSLASSMSVMSLGGGVGGGSTGPTDEAAPAFPPSAGGSSLGASYLRNSTSSPIIRSSQQSRAVSTDLTALDPTLEVSATSIGPDLAPYLLSDQVLPQSMLAALEASASASAVAQALSQSSDPGSSSSTTDPGDSQLQFDGVSTTPPSDSMPPSPSGGFPGHAAPKRPSLAPAPQSDAGASNSDPGEGALPAPVAGAAGIDRGAVAAAAAAGEGHHSDGGEASSETGEDILILADRVLTQGQEICLPPASRPASPCRPAVVPVTVQGVPSPFGPALGSAPLVTTSKINDEPAPVSEPCMAAGDPGKLQSICEEADPSVGEAESHGHSTELDSGPPVSGGEDGHCSDCSDCHGDAAAAAAAADGDVDLGMHPEARVDDGAGADADAGADIPADADVGADIPADAGADGGVGDDLGIGADVNASADTPVAASSGDDTQTDADTTTPGADVGAQPGNAIEAASGSPGPDADVATEAHADISAGAEVNADVGDDAIEGGALPVGHQ
ncbi:hypothetical protein, variant [Fonticula alba]|nr:hypothetical protein, variant [Fonticula alba]KCV68703.1 hypothetical protein, variant [Fonticula alba]|eukprot:XP_009497135.1 hypothetical protein, variant [Fonticula alba]